jgi:ABC-type molybdate transport system permease subunit
MDWPALSLSLRLGVLSVLALLPIGIVLAIAGLASFPDKASH